MEAETSKLLKIPDLFYMHSKKYNKDNIIQAKEPGNTMCFRERVWGNGEQVGIREVDVTGGKLADVLCCLALSQKPNPHAYTCFRWVI